jgi:hypothetical protein
MPAGMIQRHSREPSGMVTWVTRKKSPSHEVMTKQMKNKTDPINQARRDRLH